MEVAIIHMLHVHVHELQKGFLAWICYYVDIEKTEKGSLSGRFWRPLSSLRLACSIDSYSFGRGCLDHAYVARVQLICVVR